jgi:hypothetical protein
MHGKYRLKLKAVAMNERNVFKSVQPLVLFALFMQSIVEPERQS